MSSRAELVEKISSYLSGLGTGAVQMLVNSIERARDNGDADPALNLILEAAQKLLLSPEEKAGLLARTKRFFFEKLDDFLVDQTPGWKHVARISRTSLDPIWDWMSGEMFAEEFHARGLDDEATVLRLSDSALRDCVDAYRDQCMQRLSDILSDASSSQKMTQHFISQLGGEDVFEDLADIVYYDRIEPLLTRFTQSLPDVIDKINDQGEKSLIKRIQLFIHQRPDDHHWVFASLMPRLASPCLLAEIAVKLGGSDDIRKIEQSCGDTALSLIYYELASHVHCVTDIKSGQPDTETVTGHLLAYHELLRRVSVALDLESPSALAKDITVLRNTVSAWIDREISGISGLMRRSLRMPKDKEAPVPDFDDHLADDCERALAVLQIARQAKSSLALNQSLNSVTRDVEQSFEVLFNAALDALKQAHGAYYHYCEAVVSASIRYGTLHFGDEYAALLQRQFDAVQKQSMAS